MVMKETYDKKFGVILSRLGSGGHRALLSFTRTSQECGLNKVRRQDLFEQTLFTSAKVWKKIEFKGTKC
jgi:hypothetical protein